MKMRMLIAAGIAILVIIIVGTSLFLLHSLIKQRLIARIASSRTVPIVVKK